MLLKLFSPTESFTGSEIREKYDLKPTKKMSNALTVCISAGHLERMRIPSERKGHRTERWAYQLTETGAQVLADNEDSHNAMWPDYLKALNDAYDHEQSLKKVAKKSPTVKRTTPPPARKVSPTSQNAIDSISTLIEENEMLWDVVKSMSTQLNAILDKKQ